MIRWVDSKDKDKIRQYAEDFMSYYPKEFDYDLTSLLQILELVADNGVFLVWEGEHGEVLGCIGGIVSPHHFMPMHLVGSELFLWVEDKGRGMGLSKKLLQAFEEECAARGCRFTVMSSTVQTPKFKQHLSDEGYSEIETSYIKEVG